MLVENVCRETKRANTNKKIKGKEKKQLERNALFSFCFVRTLLIVGIFSLFLAKFERARSWKRGCDAPAACQQTGICVIFFLVFGSPKPHVEGTTVEAACPSREPREHGFNLAKRPGDLLRLPTSSPISAWLEPSQAKPSQAELDVSSDLYIFSRGGGGAFSRFPLFCLGRDFCVGRFSSPCRRCRNEATQSSVRRGGVPVRARSTRATRSRRRGTTSLAASLVSFFLRCFVLTWQPDYARSERLPSLERLCS